MSENWPVWLFWSVPTLLIGRLIYRWLWPAALYRVPWRWRRQTTSIEVPDSKIPMRLALFQRNLLADLLREGHGTNDRKLLKEADRVISTISTIQRAMDRMGFGYAYTSTEGKHVWVPNTNPTFLQLQSDAQQANILLADLISRLRVTLNSGVQKSVAAAQLELEEQKQYNDYMTEALNETRDQR